LKRATRCDVHDAIYEDIICRDDFKFCTTCGRKVALNAQILCRVRRI